MDWDDFMDFLMEGKKDKKDKKIKVKVKHYQDPQSGLNISHINPGSTSKPYSKERNAEIRELMKLNGGGAVKKMLKKRQASN